MRYRTLGRTGFRASEIGMGCGRIAEANVVRYAYDHGVNLFDTAETYGHGDSETKIGQAMQFLDREKVFIVTKLWVVAETTEQDILDRFQKSLERLQTSYADALYLHGVADVTVVGHEGFHRAVTRLKADGKLKHAGISSHGPQGDEPDSMEKVLCAAAEDGRFDVMLLSYNFMNQQEGEKVLAVCKARNVGTTGMKMAPGVLEIPPFDPDNPSEEYAFYLDDMVNNQGLSREEAVARIQRYLDRQAEKIDDTRPFAEKYGLKTQDELDLKSNLWVLQNPDMHSICISMPHFDALEKYLPLAGRSFTRADQAFLRDFEYAFGRQYCRHGCRECLAACPHRLPVSTIMRYSYYFTRQGRQKFAMGKYARLGGRNASLCLSCDGLCREACPHGLNIQAQVLKAHSLLAFQPPGTSGRMA